MAGVGKDDGRTQVVPEISLGKALDGGVRPDRHKGGRLDIAVRGVQNAGAGMGFGALGQEFEGDLASQLRL